MSNEQQEIRGLVNETFQYPVGAKFREEISGVECQIINIEEHSGILLLQILNRNNEIITETQSSFKNRINNGWVEVIY